MKLCAHDNEILRKTADDVVDLSDKKELVEQMTDFMHENNGVGLAAPQVGLSIRLFVFDDQSGFSGHILNPFIIKSARKVLLHEGCLSLPGLYLNDVRRSRKVTVNGLNVNGRRVSYDVSGFQAQIMQHEIDHLEGILFIDHSTGSKALVEEWESSLESSRHF